MGPLVTVARVALSLLVVLTIMAVVLFIQHEADRAATHRATSASQSPAVIICPTDPSSPRYNPATAGRRVSAMSDC